MARRTSAPKLLDGCPPALREALEAGGRILIAARFSTQSGRAAFARSAKNLHIAAANLARRGCVDIRHLLPTQAKLTDHIAKTVDVARHTDSKGREFAISPIVQCARELGEQFGHPMYVSEGNDPCVPWDTSYEVRLFFKIQAAAAQSKDMKDRIARSFEDKLQMDYAGGWIEWPFGMAPPPGWATAWIRDDDRSGRGRHVAFPDTPTCWPSDDLLRSPLAKIYRPGDDGASLVVVDQCHELRDALERRYVKGIPLKQVQARLVTRGFSTAGLRQQRKDPTADFSVPPPYSPPEDYDGGDVAWTAIQRRKDFYFTGELDVHVDGLSEPVHYSHMFPPGRHLSREAQAGWAAADAEAQRAYAASHRYPFGHLRGTVNGREVVLTGSYAHETDVEYRPRALPGQGPPEKGLPAAVIMGSDFACSLVDGAVAAQAPVLDLAPAPPLPEHDEIVENVESAERAVAKAQGTREQKWSFLQLTSPESGDREDPTFLRAKRDYEEADHALQDAEDALQRAKSQLEAHAPRLSDAAVEIGNLVDFVHRLADPRDATDALVWKPAIVDLQVTTHANRSRGYLIYTTRWSGLLRLTDGATVRLVPFQGQSTRAAHAQRPVRVHATIDAMRSGEPLPRREGSARQIAALTAALGHPEHTRIPASGIRDPRCLRITMAVCHPPVRPHRPPGRPVGPMVVGGPPLTRRQLPAAAKRLGEDLRLVRRIHASETPPGSRWHRWFNPQSPVLTDLYWLAAHNGGVVTSSLMTPERWDQLVHAAAYHRKHSEAGREWTHSRGRLELAPCPHCHGRRRILIPIRHTPEPICLDCELDTSGIAWPMEDYAQWLPPRPADDRL